MKLLNFECIQKEESEVFELTYTNIVNELYAMECGMITYIHHF